MRASHLHRRGIRGFTLPPRGTRGFTLIEIMIATGVFVALSGVIFSLVADASGVFHSTVQASVARRHCADVVDRLGAELTDADPLSLAIDASHAEGDRVLLQTPQSVAAGRRHLGRDGRRRRELRRLLREPLPRGRSRARRPLAARAPDRRRHRDAGRGRRDEILVDSVDAPPAGGNSKGFSVTRNNHLITLNLRVRCRGDDAAHAGDDVVKSHQITVRMRNS
jgi:prepilin-type N-terminal cleavage/methylation domain-containing protein